ncbi:MAG TPA: ribonuclease J, partial [Myxococcaceae bacterium]|nr:ribonuclease J [Myxococcaceae bacterium]
MMRVIPLGGLGEIGLNSMIIESGDELLLVDAGVMFPSVDLPGVEIIVPDFTYLRQNAHRLKGILLTHGHEDHMGALPMLLRELPEVPIYGTPFTLAVVRARLEEEGRVADLRETGPRESLHLGEGFTAEALRVSHSVPDAVGWWIRSPSGSVIHTGDFKLDPTPPDGRTTDLERLEQAGHAGVSCLLSDSTNSEVLEDTPSERLVQEAFERMLPKARGRVLISMFASNLQRVRHVLQLCARLGRKVALMGRSMGRNVEIGQKLGYLDVPEGLLVPVEEAL